METHSGIKNPTKCVLHTKYYSPRFLSLSFQSLCWSTLPVLLFWLKIPLARHCLALAIAAAWTIRWSIWCFNGFLYAIKAKVWYTKKNQNFLFLRCCLRLCSFVLTMSGLEAVWTFFFHNSFKNHLRVSYMSHAMAAGQCIKVGGNSN